MKLEVFYDFLADPSQAKAEAHPKGVDNFLEVGMGGCERPNSKQFQRKETHRSVSQ